MSLVPTLNCSVKTLHSPFSLSLSFNHAFPIYCRPWWVRHRFTVSVLLDIRIVSWSLTVIEIHHFGSCYTALYHYSRYTYRNFSSNTRQSCRTPSTKQSKLLDKTAKTWVTKDPAFIGRGLIMLFFSEGTMQRWVAASEAAR